MFVVGPVGIVDFIILTSAVVRHARYSPVYMLVTPHSSPALVYTDKDAHAAASPWRE